MSEQIITKRCSHCKQIKPVLEFYKNHIRKDGFHSACKICFKKEQKSRQQADPKKFKVIQKRYRQSDKGKIVKRKYDHSDKGRKAKNGYIKSKKGKENMRRFFQNHPEQYAAKNAISVAVSSGKLAQIISLKCIDCGNAAEQYHHHKGYSPEHLLDVVPLCKKCHYFRHHNHKVAI